MHIFVTGATGGIGMAIVRRYVEQGARVTLADRRLGDAAELVDSEPDTHYIEVDVTADESVRAAFEEARDRFGPVDVLVNAAGSIDPRPLAELTADTWMRAQAVNAYSVVACSQEFLASLEADGRSGRYGEGKSIVNIGSAAALDGRTYAPAYAASKASVVAFTKTMARQCASIGLRVNVVCPGIIDTAFNARLGELLGPALGLAPREFVERRADDVPLGRLGLAEDVACAVTFLGSADASYVTGQVLQVDGGLII